MTAVVFDNQLRDAGASVEFDFTLTRAENPQNEISTVILRTTNLINSIVFDVTKTNNSFNVRFSDIGSIERFNSRNEVLEFEAISQSNDSVPFSVSLLNIIELHCAGINKISKQQCGYSIDITFNVSSTDDYLHLLTAFLTQLADNIKIDDTDLVSLTSDLSSMSVNSSTVNSSTSLTSFSNTAKNSLTKYLNKGRLLKERKFCGSKLNNSNPTSGSNSPGSSNLDLVSSNIHHDDTDGFLILQIESATGLPPFRNSTHLTYDMDPFVVASFSKQIFKTNVCRHALNPSWKNQFINIRVSKYSFNFQLKLSVYDFDLLTSNDDICHTSINIEDLINESEFNSDDLWAYKALPLNFSNTSVLKSNKSIKLSDYSPELSIRFKYVSIDSMSTLKHDFNPKRSKCPYCGKIDKTNSSAYQHLSICKLNLKPRQFLHKSYTTSNNASRRWYAKVLAHIAYGRLTVGGNNAHILVQDRETGLVLEEKISAFVKLGIRLLYKSVKADNSSEKIKRMLRILSIKQGKRYDHPNSTSKIEGFVKFHGLSSTLTECLDGNLSNYKTFNDFFSRKLKPNARPVEGGVDNKIVVSVADSRLVVFSHVNDAKTLWIKGSGFSINKLLGRTAKSSSEDYSVAIFRLAPQDYHRFHCPLNGKILKISHIHGTYYTVNPMAVRSELDVFGENIRCVVSLETEEYGVVEVVMVGAMMVGSILLSVKIGDTVLKGQELGYFKFGGSTVVLIFKNHPSESEYQSILWDADLVYNSNKKLETLVKVGMSVGHSDKNEPYQRHIKKNVTESERREVIRRVTGLGDGFGVGVGENIKSKLGNMIDDVISMTGSGKTSIFGTDRNIDDMVLNNWEINELTTLDDINDDVEIMEMSTSTTSTNLPLPHELFDGISDDEFESDTATVDTMSDV